MGESLVIERARPDEAGEALYILAEASRWLSSRGIDQWPMKWLDSPAMRSWMEERTARGELYFAVADGKRAATFTLVPGLIPRDRSLWGALPDDGAYLHSLAVKRALAGRGFGAELVRRAEAMAVAAGKRFLRLDCWSENPFLCSWYEGMGFVVRGVGETDAGKWKLSLYEKELGDGR